jgi:hypothetical protein
MEVKMGNGDFRPAAYARLAAQAKEANNSGFPKQACAEFNPATVTTRFSKRGPFNEFRDVIPILIGLDVTGSMDIVSKNLVKGQLGSLMTNLKKVFNRPNENLQMSFAGIGDAKSDKAPLQVTHFESDERVAEQLNRIYLEGAGGGNGAESYNLLWWYAANKTQLSCIKDDKHKRKGILITVGDDNVHPSLLPAEIHKILDPHYSGKDEVSNKSLLEAARKQYEIYHIVLIDGHAYNFGVSLEGSFEKTDEDKLKEANKWKSLLGETNVIYTQIEKVHEAIVEIVTRNRPIQNAEMVNLNQEEWSRKNKENLTEGQWIEVLSYTLCPLTSVYMDDPVECDGVKRAYQRKAIEDYIREHQKHPMTKKNATLEKLQPNERIRVLCKDYRSFFDALPDPTKLHLINLAKDKIKAIDKSASSSEYYNVEIARNSAASSVAASGSASSTPPPKVSSASSSSADKDKGASAVAVLPASNLGLFSHKPAASSAPSAAASSSAADKALQSFEKMRSDLECPISHRIMKDPVILVATGQSYERKKIEMWLAKNDTCPATNVKVADKTLVPNYALKRLCDEARLSQGKSDVDDHSDEDNHSKNSSAAPAASMPRP